MARGFPPRRIFPKLNHLPEIRKHAYGPKAGTLVEYTVRNWTTIAWRTKYRTI